MRHWALGVTSASLTRRGADWSILPFRRGHRGIKIAVPISSGVTPVHLQSSQRSVAQQRRLAASQRRARPIQRHHGIDARPGDLNGWGTGVLSGPGGRGSNRPQACLGEAHPPSRSLTYGCDLIRPPSRGGYIVPRPRQPPCSQGFTGIWTGRTPLAGAPSGTRAPDLPHP